MTGLRAAPARAAIVAILAAACAFQVVRSAAQAQWVDERPDLAARAWAAHPAVQIAVAMAEIGRSAGAGKPPSAASVARVMTAARRAPLAVEPFVIEGTIATAELRPAAAEKLFVEAKRRDPRSAAARYFLAQHYVATGRPRAGLAEMSVLSRLVPEGIGAVVPGLVQYAHSPGAAANLKPMLAANPALGEQVLVQLARDADNADLVVAIVGDAALRGGAGKAAPPWLSPLLDALVARGDFSRAHALWRKATGVRGAEGALFNPQFAAVAAPPPFNWALASGDFGVAEPVAEGGLLVIYYGRANADLATQTLLLAPGAYVLTMDVTRDGGGEAPSGLGWTIDCQPTKQVLLNLPVGAGAGAARLAGRFTVPAGCAAQRLRLSGTARDLATSEQAVFARLNISGAGQ